MHFILVRYIDVNLADLLYMWSCNDSGFSLVVRISCTLMVLWDTHFTYVSQSRDEISQTSRRPKYNWSITDIDTHIKIGIVTTSHLQWRKGIIYQRKIRLVRGKCLYSKAVFLVEGQRAGFLPLLMDYITLMLKIIAQSHLQLIIENFPFGYEMGFAGPIVNTSVLPHLKSFIYKRNFTTFL